MHLKNTKTDKYTPMHFKVRELLLELSESYKMYNYSIEVKKMQMFITLETEHQPNRA